MCGSLIVDFLLKVFLDQLLIQYHGLACNNMLFQLISLQQMFITLDCHSIQALIVVWILYTGKHSLRMSQVICKSLLEDIF